MEYKHSKVWLVVVLLLWLLLLDGFFPHKWTTLSTVGQVVCPNTLECQLIASSQKLEWSKLVSILQVMWIPFSIKHTNVHPIIARITRSTNPLQSCGNEGLDEPNRRIIMGNQVNNPN